VVTAVRNDESNPVRWPVDFVEHLRKVHFGLASVSAVLILVVAGARNLPVSRALTQSTQIIESLSKWSEVQNTIYLAAYASRIPDDRYLMHITGGPSSGIAPKGEWVSMTINAEAFLDSQPLFEDDTVQVVPKTLFEFAKWWNGLHSGVTAQVIILPDSDYTCSAKIASPSLDLQQHPKKYALRCEIISDDTDDILYDVPIDGWAVVDDESGRHAIPGGEVDFDSTDTPAGPIKKKNPKKVMVTKSFEYRDARTDESALAKLYPDWRTGPYDEAFRELAAVSNGIENIEISAVPGRIQSMQAISERDVEIFGLKMQAAGIAVPGTLLLLIAQLYFWLHLNELSARPTPQTPGRDVAWIGAYSSPVARISTFTSACILPAVAAAIAAYKVLIGAHAAGSTWTFWSTAVLVSLVLAMATALGLRRLQISWQTPVSSTDGSKLS
jgi:hypothetical protein